MSKQQPIIVYVDDESRNLAVFEASMPEEWEIHTFADPMKALGELESIDAWILLSDQKMPGCTGVKFLEIAQKVLPHAVRIIVTGYSEESLIVDSVKKAKVFDYIRKPWDVDDLENSLSKAVEYYSISREKEDLLQRLEANEKKLRQSNLELLETNAKLTSTVSDHEKLGRELECWVPPFIHWNKDLHKKKFPFRVDLVGITYDIVDSSELHNKTYNDVPIRAEILNKFTEILIRHYGWRESHSGDSAYGHFGLIVAENIDPYESAIAVAREFRVAIRNLAKISGISFECGIAIHLCTDSFVNLHEVKLYTPKGEITQKSFDTASPEIDLLHRAEKIAHSLPGTNIIISESVFKKFKDTNRIVSLGVFGFKGQEKDVRLYAILSDLVDDKSMANLQSLAEFKSLE